MRLKVSATHVCKFLSVITLISDEKSAISIQHMNLCVHLISVDLLRPRVPVAQSFVQVSLSTRVYAPKTAADVATAGQLAADAWTSKLSVTGAAGGGKQIWIYRGKCGCPPPSKFQRKSNRVRIQTKHLPLMRT